MSRDVFLSYKTEDREAAERLCSALEREKISCWLAPRDIPPGQEWAAAIVDGLQKSKCFVLLLSSHSVEAKQIAREAELADRQNLPIITFRLEDVQPPKELLYFLGNIQWLDGFGDRFEAAANRLVEVVRHSESDPEPVAPSAPRIAAVTPIAPVNNRKPYLLAIGAAVMVILGLGAWFGLRKPETPQPPEGKTVIDAAQQAKTEADRFLKERDSGQFDRAWDEYTEGFRNRFSRTQWQSDTEERNREHGGVLEHQYDHCLAGSNPDIFVCEYTLVCKDQTRFKNELRVVKAGAGWLIDNGKIKEEK